MTFSVEEILLIIGLMIAIISGLFAGFAFCMSKAVRLTKDLAILAKDLATLNEKYEALEAAKFSMDERMDRHELKITEMDKTMALNSQKLDTVIDEISKISTVIGKIFDIMDTKQNKVAV